MVLANTGWMLADRLTRLVLALVVGIWVARYLGPEQFGLLSYALALTAVLGAIAGTGVDSLVVRELVKNPGDRDRVLGSAATLRLAGALLAMLLAALAALLLRPNDPILFWLVSIAALGFLFQPVEVIDLLFQARMTPRFAVIARLVAYLVGALLRIGLILAGGQVLSFVLVHVAELALAAIGLLVAYRRTESDRTRWRFSLSGAGTLLREALPLALSMLVIAAQMRIDQLLLGQLVGDRAVGIYSAAARVTEAFVVVPYTAVLAAVPVLVKLRGEHPSRYIGALKRLCASMMLFCYAVAACVSTFAAQIVAVLFGASYAESGPVLAVHIWTLLFIALGTAISHYLVIEGHAYLTLYRTITGCVLSVALNAVLIPRFGVLGAAWATLIAYALATFAVLHRRHARVVVRILASSLLLAPLYRRSVDDS